MECEVYGTPGVGGVLAPVALLPLLMLCGGTAFLVHLGPGGQTECGSDRNSTWKDAVPAVWLYRTLTLHLCSLWRAGTPGQAEGLLQLGQQVGDRPGSVSCQDTLGLLALPASQEWSERNQ